MPQSRPQTCRQTERANRIIEGVLQQFVSPNMTDWDRYLCMAHFAMFSAWHEIIQQTPFILIKRRQVCKVKSHSK